MKNGEKYRVYTVDSKFPSGGFIHEDNVWWNRTSQDLKANLNVPYGYQGNPEGSVYKDVIIPKGAIITIDVSDGDIAEVRNLATGEIIEESGSPTGTRFGAYLYIHPI